MQLHVNKYMYDKSCLLIRVLLHALQGFNKTNLMNYVNFLQMTPQGSIQCTHSHMVVKSCFTYQHFCLGLQVIDNRYNGRCLFIPLF